MVGIICATAFAPLPILGTPDSTLSPMTAYSIDIRPSVRRAMRRLDPVARQAVAKAIDALASEPRPSGARALTGHRPYLRVRTGDYRIIFSVDDGARTVTIVVVGHRREIYQNLDL